MSSVLLPSASTSAGVGNWIPFLLATRKELHFTPEVVDGGPI